MGTGKLQGTTAKHIESPGMLTSISALNQAYFTWIKTARFAQDKFRVTKVRTLHWWQFIMNMGLWYFIMYVCKGETNQADLNFVKGVYSKLLSLLSFTQCIPIPQNLATLQLNLHVWWRYMNIGMFVSYSPVSISYIYLQLYNHYISGVSYIRPLLGRIRLFLCKDPLNVTKHTWVSYQASLP